MQYTNLAAFLSGYMHQDWDTEFSSPSEAASDFGRSAALEIVIRALGEGAILVASKTDPEIAAWLRASGCYVTIPSGGGAGGWLKSVLEEVAESAASRPSCDSS